jgi:hypothetical protein
MPWIRGGALILPMLQNPPALAMTDSQAFLRVAGDVPAEVVPTSFSILFARLKEDLHEFVHGVKTIDSLKSGSRILVLELCAHHPIGEDIGRVKIPRWVRQYTGLDLEFVHKQGHDFPEDIRCTVLSFLGFCYSHLNLTV